MIEMACPKCGGAGRIPRDKLNSRLVCKKCLVVFHVATNGRAILGEPPADAPTGKGAKRAHTKEAAPKAAGGGWKENLPEITIDRKSAVISLAVVVLLGGAYFLYSRPAERLEERRREIAQTFADGNLARFKEYSDSSTEDDMVQWYGVAHTQLQALKKEWLGRDPLVRVLVIEENPRQRSGQATVFITPSKASSHAKDIATEAGMSNAGSKSMETTLFFTPDKWGKWRLDGKRTLANAQRNTVM